MLSSSTFPLLITFALSHLMTGSFQTCLYFILYVRLTDSLTIISHCFHLYMICNLQPLIAFVLTRIFSFYHFTLHSNWCQEHPPTSPSFPVLSTLANPAWLRFTILRYEIEKVLRAVFSTQDPDSHTTKSLGAGPPKLPSSLLCPPQPFPFLFSQCGKMCWSAFLITGQPYLPFSNLSTGTCSHFYW